LIDCGILIKTRRGTNFSEFVFLLLAVTRHQPTTIRPIIRRKTYIRNIPPSGEMKENKIKSLAEQDCTNIQIAKMSGVAQPHPELNMASILTGNNVDDFYGALGTDPNSTREQIVAEFKARVRVKPPPMHYF
jgi:hypothetical protein